MLKQFLPLFTFLLLLCQHANAESSATNLSNVSRKIQQLTPFEVQSVQSLENIGLVEVVTDKGIYYSTKDAEFLISGSIYRFESGLFNLTSERKSELGAAKIEGLKDSFITYQSELQKHEIIVFYDTSCGFCKKLHSEIDALMEQGITVHYAAWPRDGVVRKFQNKTTFTAGYERMRNIWCAGDPKSALNNANDGAKLPTALCDNKIKEQFELGEYIGVRATPSIFNMEGKVVSIGYKPALQLVDLLNKDGK